MVLSSLLSFSGSAEASQSNPQKGVVVSSLSGSAAGVIVTDLYLNESNAKKFATKLENKNTKVKDVGMFLVSAVPYIGPFLGANYMIDGWKLKDDAAKIRKLLKQKDVNGVRIQFVESTGRGSSRPARAVIAGWSGKRSTIKSHHVVSASQKKSLSHSVKTKIYN